MFTEEPEIKMEILDDGKVNITIITNYLKNGVKVGEDNWGCCLEPHLAYLDYASTILDEYHLNILRNVWTQDVMDSYARKLEKDRQQRIGEGANPLF